MSRYYLKSDKYIYKPCLGWNDNKKSLYAIIKTKRNIKASWIGNGYGSISSVKRLQELIAAYGVVLPKDIATKLKKDSE